MPYMFEELDPIDYFTATSTYFKDDFTSVAHFAVLDGDLSESNMLGEAVNLDLMIQNVLCSFGDYNKMLAHLGDTFSIHYFGRSPMALNIQGFLVDSSSNYGKADLVKLYRDVLRVKAVARTGVAPVLIFPGMAVQGAISEMNIEENSETQTTISVSMKMLVIRVLAVAPENKGAKSVLFDYTTGLNEQQGPVASVPTQHKSVSAATEAAKEVVTETVKQVVPGYSKIEVPYSYKTI